MRTVLRHLPQTSIVDISCFQQSSDLDRPWAITALTVSHPKSATDLYVKHMIGVNRDYYSTSSILHE
jgi:hypothetical protein